MLIIGLTGNIASGKSTITDMLKKAHIPIIDADVLAKIATKKGSPALKKIALTFGKEFLNKNESLNRKKIAHKVFFDKEALETLENIVHPCINELVTQLIKKYELKGEKIIVFVAPLLFEKNLEHLVDKTILVTADLGLLIDRLQKRDGYDKEKAMQILSLQLPNYIKIPLADEVIINNSSLGDLFLALKKAWKRLTGMDFKK